MSRSAWIVLALLALALAGSFALIRALEPASVVAEAPPDPIVASQTPSTTTAAPLEHAAEAPTRAVVREAPKPAAPDSAPTDDTELADALWVEGRVVFPNDTPLDEEVWVVAKGRKFERRPLHKMKVGADGRFRVAFAAKTKKATLALEAHYLYLAQPVTFAASEPPADLVLSPLVGGRIRGAGRVALGRNDHLERARGANVQLYGFDMGDHGGGSNVQRSVALDAALAFDLGGLDPAFRFNVVVTPKGMAPAERDGVRVSAGKTIELEFELQEGAKLSGVVVDEAGAPIAKAGFVLQYPRNVRTPEQTTAEDGTFEFTGLAPGKLTLTARKSGLVPAKFDAGELTDGLVRNDLRIVLARGLALSGRVTWPDGAPAKGAYVRVEPEAAERRFPSPEENVKVRDDGTFEFTGLAEGRYTVRASGKRAAEPAAASAAESRPSGSGGEGAPAKDESVAAATKAASAKVKAARAPAWTVERKDVAAGTNGLELVLGSGLALRGRVVDDTGAAVTSFRIEALPIGERPWDRDWSRRQSRTFEDADGAFALEGLAGGRCGVKADVKGLQSTEEVVELDAGPAPLVLRVPRGGKLAGLVVDAAGAPKPGARVRRVVESTDTFGFRIDEKKGVDWADCDAAGRFEFTQAPVGNLRLVASARDAAESLPVDAFVALGETRDVRIVLRQGGTIRGRVFDVEGRPENARSIRGWCDGQSGSGVDTTSNERGEFVLEHVTPGRWTLMTEATEEETAKATDSKGRINYDVLQARQRNVEVVDGQTIEVQLGGVEKDAIVVRGKVTRGGKPVTEVDVNAWLQGASTDANARRNASCRGRDDGTYELALSGPGIWSFSFRVEGGASTSRTADIPPGPSFALDVDLPTGRLAGRVVDREGRALAEQHVLVTLTPGTPRDGQAWSSGSAQTNADGRFAMDGLAPGTYEARVGQNFVGFGEARYGSARRGGIVVPETGSAEEVVIVLDLAGQIIGTVIGADGNPCSGADVRALRLASEGYDAYDTASARTDATGSFTIGGLAPGTFEVRATSGRETTRDAPRVVVRSSEKAEARLALVVGGTLLVSAVDASGKRVGAWCAVVDEWGNDVARATRVEQVPDPAGGKPSVRYGPLPPGRFRVSAKNRDGVEASAEATIASGAEASVVLQYGGAPR
ncbi:MAG: carboxypeptidase regulatory-like domain-containing protein [Planctomycetes bacterium]|nr:carboxypeptidase regulatory-like domain-containing protein [Planctomycetota bacterium]